MPSLVTCKICGKKKISAMAEVCPQCGHPHEKDRIAKNNLMQMLCILAFVLVVLLFVKLGWAQGIAKHLFGSLFPK